MDVMSPLVVMLLTRNFVAGIGKRRDAGEHDFERKDNLEVYI